MTLCGIHTFTGKFQLDMQGTPHSPISILIARVTVILCSKPYTKLAETENSYTPQFMCKSRELINLDYPRKCSIHIIYN